MTRVGHDGKPRYLAQYRDLRGCQQSAGTFASKRERWLPHYVVKPTTREKYHGHGAGPGDHVSSQPGCADAFCAQQAAGDHHAEQFDAIYRALPTADDQLLVETLIESGLRWGELTELRVRDLSFTTRILTVSRKVIEVDPKFGPERKRFAVMPYPKDKEYRRLKISTQLVRKIEAHVMAVGLGPGDLLFKSRAEPPRPRWPEVLPDPETLGFTEPNDKGRNYRRATLSAYTGRRCRCEHCRAAFAHYRARRRAEGSDRPRTTQPYEPDEHISRNWFRTHVWRPACEGDRS